MSETLPSSERYAEEQGFLDAIEADPYSFVDQGAYLDWCEDHGDNRRERFAQVIAKKFPDFKQNPADAKDPYTYIVNFWIDSPEKLDTFLSGLNLPKGFDPKELEKMFKTIEVGTIPKGETPQQTQENFRQALRQGGHRISAYADQLLGTEAFHDSVSEQPARVKIVEVTVSQLFPEFSNKDLPLPEGVHRNPDRATRNAMYQRAQEWGLAIGSPQLGPYERLKGDPQDNCRMGMLPIAVSDGRLNVFRVSRNSGESWLHTFFDREVNQWSSDHHWIFPRGK